MSKTLLNASNIAHSFDYQLFSNIDFDLKEKESIAIVGRSGSGKSTLLHIFSTFIKPDEGRVTLFDQNIYNLSETKIEDLRRHELGIIFQAHYLFKGMSTLMNIEIATLLSNETIDNNLLERLEIKELMQQKIGELSGGQQQRVSIARVLSKRPKIIFADEPTGNLDKETAKLVMDVLLEYIEKENAALVLVTHDEEMARLCNKHFSLEQKELKELKELV
ncbi:MAG: Putative ABC transporter ATP binding protein [uncultured Sulfurovum sp.]|uniref:ABC transporter ATP binding protein n=1 Tax=uncultured Sulfurovum sp. TaxID=269237 RepID=A0A6S6TDE2_9BACT|nr:MAG: Putative ABC transporter ATP binding protein [uncultured Sulfurovum sp.]